jgi:DNA-binding HxlR family transcriptional regulator
MLAGETRFSAIAETVPGMSDRMLAERLRELEEEGVLVRTVFPETPVRIDYTLTEKGRELAPVVDALSTWAVKWASSEGCGDPQAEVSEGAIQ